MFAPVFQTLNTPAVSALVGGRIFSSGNAPQNTPTPYVTWFVVTGDPYDQISGPPVADRDSIQIDCWTGPHDNEELVCVSLARAVRNALDDAGHANRIIINTREADTKLFRIALQADFIRSR